MSNCKCGKESEGPQGSAFFGLKGLNMLFGLKKRLRKGEGSDNFLSSGGGAVHLKVSKRFPVLATLAHPQLGQTLVQTSKKHTGLAHLQ